MEIGKRQNSTHHRIKTPGLIAKKIVMGDQVGEETRSAKFAANRYTGVFRGDMPIFQISFFYIYFRYTRLQIKRGVADIQYCTLIER